MYITQAGPVISRAPRGWNSYDNWGGDINETTFLEDVAGMAQLDGYGFDYAVLDGGWVANGDDFDEYGGPWFNSTDWPLAQQTGSGAVYGEKVQAAGLEFGIWYIRGAHFKTVNRTVKGTEYTIGDIIDQRRRNNSCPWSSIFLGVNASHPAAQAYYDSVVELFDSWKVTFIKWDCMEFEQPEMLLASNAIQRLAPHIKLSYSAGVVQNHPDEGRWITNSTVASMYRIVTDFWGGWGQILAGMKQMIEFAPLIGVNYTYPDLDMIPYGSIKCNINNGKCGGPYANHNQIQFMMSLYMISKAPLMFGGRLPTDEKYNYTLGYLLNDAALTINDQGHNVTVQMNTTNYVIWTSDLDDCPIKPGLRCGAVGVFNYLKEDVMFDIGHILPLFSPKHGMRYNVWTNKEEPYEQAFNLTSQTGELFLVYGT